MYGHMSELQKLVITTVYLFFLMQINSKKFIIKIEEDKSPGNKTSYAFLESLPICGFA